MFRYLPGLLLVQCVTVALVLLNAGAEPHELALRAGLPALVIALVSALWFRSLSRTDGERDLARTRFEHERERERLREDAARTHAELAREAERERIELLRESERTVRREERRVTRRANLQVGLAFAATGGIGVLFLLSELLTLGLLTLSVGGGALGGYVLRWRQTRAVPRVVADARRGPAEQRVPAAGEVPSESPGAAAGGSGLPMPHLLEGPDEASARTASPGAGEVGETPTGGRPRRTGRVP